MRPPPIGIIILAFFALMAGVANLVVGVQITGWVAFGPGEVGGGSFFWGLLTLGIGIAYVAAALALWAKQTWAWFFTFLLAIFALLDAVFVTISSDNLAYGFAAALIPIVVIWYLNRPGIQGAFGISDAEPPAM